MQVGDLAWKKTSEEDQSKTEEVAVPEFEAFDTATVPRERNESGAGSVQHSIAEIIQVDLETYIPDVSRATGEWFLSETDLVFIGEGCGILGTGGGGSVYTGLLHSQEVLRTSGRGKMRIVETKSLPSQSHIGAVAFAGAPSVSNERLINGNEMELASQDLSKFLGISGGR